MSSGPFFTDEDRNRNPVLGAEFTNGYFDALHRRRTLYGDRWFKVTGNTPEGIPVEDRVSPWRMFVPKVGVRKNYTVDSQDLYLAGISGRDILEGLYLLEQVGSRTALKIMMLILALPIFFLFVIAPILNPAAWLLWLSYLVFYVEVIQDFNIRMGLGGLSMRNELMRWRALAKKRIPLMTLFLDMIAVIIGGILVFILIILVLIFIGILIGIIGSVAVELNNFYQFLNDWKWKAFFVDGLGYQIGALILFVIALNMAFTRETRRQKSICFLIKTFEEGRRDYDAYYLCDVQKDTYDGLGWVTFFYDFGFMKEDKTLFEKFFEYYKIK